MEQTLFNAKRKPGYTDNRWIFLILAFLVSLSSAKAGDSAIALTNKADPHRTGAGFFDIHVCNWPDRPLFLMALLSTERFDEIESVDIHTPDNKLIGSLDKNKYRLIIKDKKPEKRAFITQLELPDQAPNGWYKAEIVLKDGSQYTAKDYVIINAMERANGINPENETDNIAIPRMLTWKPIVGAKFYQVFIRDEWTGETLHQSELLSKPELELPDGLLKSGGYYSWRIHARDVNENILLGDFNHGSLSKINRFSIADSIQAAHKK